MSKALKLEKSREEMAIVCSEFMNQLSEIQDASIPDASSTDSVFAVWRILETMRNDATVLDETLVKIRESIEKLKSYEGLED